MLKGIEKIEDKYRIPRDQFFSLALITVGVIVILSSPIAYSTASSPTPGRTLLGLGMVLAYSGILRGGYVTCRDLPQSNQHSASEIETMAISEEPPVFAIHSEPSSSTSKSENTPTTSEPPTVEIEEPDERASIIRAKV